MKITVIGGGSTYTPELVNGFLERANSFPLQELCLLDIDPQRLEIVGGFAQRMAAAKGSPFQVVLSTDQRQAIRGAAYVITQLRVGMMAARREDEYLGQRHGLIGQETTGVGGMAKALRTIPVIMDIAADMSELAPGALLVNFTNPSGLVTEALFRAAPQVPTVGVCNSGIGMKMSLLKRLAGILPELPQPVAQERTRLDTLGLNHLTWYRGFTLDGEELWPQIMDAYLNELRDDPHPEWDPHIIEALNMIPNGYLQYFYDTPKKLADQAKWPPSRAENVMAIEQGLLRQYADPGLSELPADLMKRGGAYYSTLATQLVDSHYNNLGQVHIVNVRQAGAIPGWPEDWVLELPCKIDSAGIHPLPAHPLPPACAGLVAQVKAYELHTVEAALNGDRHAASLALLAHPLGPSASQVPAVLGDMLATHSTYLPQFK